jgi:hypothetical protein
MFFPYGTYSGVNNVLLVQDKGNIGNARVAGLQKQLAMSDDQVRHYVSVNRAYRLILTAHTV